MGCCHKFLIIIVIANETLQFRLLYLHFEFRYATVLYSYILYLKSQKSKTHKADGMLPSFFL